MKQVMEGDECFFFLFSIGWWFFLVSKPVFVLLLICGCGQFIDRKWDVREYSAADIISSKER